MSAETAIDISIVIVTFNNAHEISDCLNALFADLPGRRCQLIIVDNCSQDATGEIIRAKADDLLKQCLDFSFIENTFNCGFTHALNQGLKKVTGETVLILNPDTQIQPGCTKILSDLFAENDRVGVAAPQLLNSDGSIQPSCRRFPRRRDVFIEMTCLPRLFKTSKRLNYWKMGDFDHRTARVVEQPQGAFLLTRRDVLNKVGLWDERFPMFFSDVDWCKRVALHGYQIYFEPKAKVVHKQGISILQRRQSMIWSSHLSFYRYFQKYGRQKNVPGLNEMLRICLLVTAIIRILWYSSFGRFKSQRKERR